MGALQELKKELEDLEQQLRQLLEDTLNCRGITIDEALKIYGAVRQIQKVADDIEINYTE